ncbi:MAG TPA: YncE family protein [Bacteroidota bacterium]|nr:YncE family protein [Bacteroidota bacterium]
MMRSFNSILLWLILSGAAFAQTGANLSGYHIIDSVRLGGEGGWDYLSVDSAAQRVYVSRATRVQVVDVASRQLVGEVPHTPGVHGIALDVEAGKGYTSNGRDSSVSVFDLKTLATVAVIKIDASNPDAILFEPYTKRVFTFNGRSDNATVIETKTDRVAGTIKLDGRPEFAAADGRGMIYVNIEDKSELASIDARSLKVITVWSLAPGEGPSGLAIDRIHRRLYSGCDNRLMVVSDADQGRVIGTVPIGQGVDGTAFDHLTGFAFSANGEGTLTVFSGPAPQNPDLLENIPTRRGARTLTVDEKTHRVYTVTARFGPPPPASTEQPRPRPTMEPGSVTLYIIGR